MEIVYILLALFIAFLWGGSTVVHRCFINNMSIATIMCISTSFYVLCLLIYGSMNYKIIKNDIRNISLADVGILGITSISAGFLANYLYFTVLRKYESSLVSALIYSCPIFTLLLANFYLSEKIDNYGIFGILFVVLGVGFISKSKSSH